MKNIFLKSFLMLWLLLSLSPYTIFAMKKNDWKKITRKKYHKKQNRTKLRSKFPFKGAGVMPYVKKANKVYFLISKHAEGKNKGKWGDFGGGMEKKDTTIEDAAAREAFEESLGYFGNKSFWKNKIKKSKFDILENYKYKFAGVSYLVDITQKIGDIPLEKIIKGLTKKLNEYKEKAIEDPKKYRAYTEKDEFKWVDSQELKNFSYNKKYRVPLWRTKKLIQLAQ